MGLEVGFRESDFKATFFLTEIQVGLQSDFKSQF